MIIKETRWKCDYCGVVSPVIEEGEKPSGWTFIVYPTTTAHFCCESHQNTYIADPSKEHPIPQVFFKGKWTWTG